MDTQNGIISFKAIKENDKMRFEVEARGLDSGEEGSLRALTELISDALITLDDSINLRHKLGK